jgi:hypothetical protein
MFCSPRYGNQQVVDSMRFSKEQIVKSKENMDWAKEIVYDLEKELAANPAAREGGKSTGKGSKVVRQQTADTKEAALEKRRTIVAERLSITNAESAERSSASAWATFVKWRRAADEKVPTQIRTLMQGLYFLFEFSPQAPRGEGVSEEDAVAAMYTRVRIPKDWELDSPIMRRWETCRDLLAGPALLHSILNFTFADAEEFAKDEHIEAVAILRRFVHKYMAKDDSEGREALLANGGAMSLVLEDWLRSVVHYVHNSTEVRRLRRRALKPTIHRPAVKKHRNAPDYVERQLKTRDLGRRCQALDIRVPLEVDVSGGAVRSRSAPPKSESEYLPSDWFEHSMREYPHEMHHKSPWSPALIALHGDVAGPSSPDLSPREAAGFQFTEGHPVFALPDPRSPDRAAWNPANLPSPREGGRPAADPALAWTYGVSHGKLPAKTHGVMRRMFS